MGSFVLKEGSGMGWDIVQGLICIKACDAAQSGVVTVVGHGFVLEITSGA